MLILDFDGQKLVIFRKGNDVNLVMQQPGFQCVHTCTLSFNNEAESLGFFNGKAQTFGLHWANELKAFINDAPAASRQSATTAPMGGQQRSLASVAPASSPLAPGAQGVASARPASGNAFSAMGARQAASPSAGPTRDAGPLQGEPNGVAVAPTSARRSGFSSLSNPSRHN